MALSYVRTPADAWHLDGLYTQLTSDLRIDSVGFSVKLSELYNSLIERGEVR